MTILDGLVLAISVFALTIVFMFALTIVFRVYKRNSPDSDADETDDAR